MPDANSSVMPLFGDRLQQPACKPAQASAVVSVWPDLPSLTARGSSRTSRAGADEVEAAEILIKARKEADELARTAQSQAQAVLDEARSAALVVHQDAYVEGYSAGLINARQEVEADLKARFDARCAALQAGVDEIVEAILVDRELLFRNMEGEVTSLALEIAKKIVKLEIAQNPDVVKSVIRDALHRVTERNTLRILVNPDDLQHVRNNKEDVLMAIDGVKNLEIDGDRRVGRGGCVIETNAGSIDAKISTQLEQVETALRG